MRVGYILSMFPCWSETFILREMLELQRRGVELTVFSLKPCNEDLVQPEAAALVAQGRVVYTSRWSGLLRFVGQCLRHPLVVGKLMIEFRRSYCGSSASLLRSFASMVLASDVLAHARTWGVEHLHAPWGTYPSTAALFCARIAGYPFSFTTRAHDLFLEDHGLALKFAEARFAQTITEYNRRLIEGRYLRLPAGGLHVIHSALYPEAFDGERQPTSPPMLLSVGRLVEMKGFADLIDACALLRSRGIAYCCRIVGDGPLKQNLKGRIERLGLDADVQLLDPMPQPEIRRLLIEATCFVLPCVMAADGDQDGIPNVLMEALAARVPAISCPTSGVPELIEHERTGLLAPQRDPAALSRAIERVVTDPPLQHGLAVAGHAKVHAEFNIRTNAARMGELMVDSRKVRRVALIIGELESGGAQRQVFELAAGLMRTGIAVRVIYFRADNPEMLGEFQQAGIPTKLVRKQRRIDAGFLLRLRRDLADWRPDVVQTYTATADLWGRAAALLAGTPVIVSAARTDKMSASMRLLDPFTAGFTANSRAVLASVVTQRGVDQRRVTVIPNGIALYDLARAAFPRDGMLVIGTVARLDEQKNLSCLLRATARLVADGVPVTIEIVGDGPLRGALEKEAATLGVSRLVTFWGLRPNVGEFLKRWHVAVLPSWHEGQSNFLMEAMAARLPIAASDIPGNRELLHNGQAGRLFSPRQPQALADILVDFQRNPKEAEALGERARQLIEGYSVEAMVSAHAALYERLLRQVMPRARRSEAGGIAGEPARVADAGRTPPA
jgi:glycosyltransferase involved in cell wall biosynthesis